MLRKLGVVGLGVPLIAVVGALIYLFAFGTDAPTFDAATRELARDYTVVRLSEAPKAALVVPETPPSTLPIFVILADEQRHIWNAVRELDLLELVEPEGIALLIAPGVSDPSLFRSLVDAASRLAPVQISALTAFDGPQLRALCQSWSEVIAVAEAPLPCGETRVSIVAPGREHGRRIVDAMRSMFSSRAGS